MQIKESAENYLETIYILKNTIGAVRSIDVANHLGYSKPSVSNAMKLFREHDYVTVDSSGYITLTESGLEIALQMFERHQLLTKFLKHLGVSDSVAKEDACRIEHHISEESFEKISEFCNKYIFNR